MGVRYWLLPMLARGVQRQFRSAVTSVTAKGPLPEKIAAEAAKAVPLTAAQYETYLAASPVPFASSSIDNGGTAASGPASFQRSNFWAMSADRSVWVKVQLPPIPNLELSVEGARVVIDHVWDTAHADVYNQKSPFETPTFERLSFSEQPGSPPRLAAIRDVHLLPSASLESLAGIEGKLILRLPVECQELAFVPNGAGQEQSAGPATVTWVGLTGSDVAVDFKGPAENYVAMLAYNAQGQPLERVSHTVPDPTHAYPVVHLLSRFQGVPSKVVVIVARSVLERTYPFRLGK